MILSRQLDSIFTPLHIGLQIWLVSFLYFFITSLNYKQEAPCRHSEA